MPAAVILSFIKLNVDILEIFKFIQAVICFINVIQDKMLSWLYINGTRYGLGIGFKSVFAGPFVRSSYMADLVSAEASGE